MKETREVCELFDVQVLSDLMEDGLRDVPCVYLGARYDSSAGIRGFSMTRPFRTAEELNEWCKRWLEKLRVIASAEDYETPDAADWP